MKYRKYFQDINKRKLYKNSELVQRIIKILSFSFSDNVLKLLLLEKKKNNYQPDCFSSRIKNFCVVSGRGRGVHRKFKISRIVLREFAGKGLFFGFKKSSW